jgi:hypothetical protein
MNALAAAATAVPAADAEATPMTPAPQTFIRAVEVWVPDAEGMLLVLGSAWYGTARRFGLHSSKMCFGRGEGLPGQAWHSGHPVLIKQFEGSAFRRTAAAHAEGLTSAVALPVFAGEVVKAVVLIFCGDNPDTQAQQAGAIELWRNQPATSKDMLLDDGYYGAISTVFEFISRRTAFRNGHGLPGQVWASGLPVFWPDLGKGGRFLRADSAQKVGINRGFALPCATTDGDHWVMAFLSALGTPLVRRFENWLPDAASGHLLRSEGFCEQAGALEAGLVEHRVDKGQGALGRAWATGAPAISQQATLEPGGVGAGASAAGLGTVVALPMMQAAQVVAVVAWYF